MEMVLIIFFATMSLSFGIAYLATFDKLKKSNVLLGQLFIKNKTLEGMTSQIQPSHNMTDSEIHKENFIKFLSDSRDWAFDYIESSQKTIKEISIELNKDGLTEYSKKLLSLLPKEINNENKK